MQMIIMTNPTNGQQKTRVAEHITVKVIRGLIDYFEDTTTVGELPEDELDYQIDYVGKYIPPPEGATYEPA